jgi:hypothetical protein
MGPGILRAANFRDRAVLRPTTVGVYWVNIVGLDSHGMG